MKRYFAGCVRSVHNKCRKNCLISTPIYYVNGNPHIGHAYTSVCTDVIVRFRRLQGLDVCFVTGTDEHGQKVELSAKAAGKEPLEFASVVSQLFLDLAVELNCSHDKFIRTTSKDHKIAAQALWNKLEDNGQIYLGTYEGWYSVRDEAFYLDHDLVDGKAPTGAEVVWVKEKSFFFKLSEWRDKLLELYERVPDFISPPSSKSEIISFLKRKEGLKDLSISRTNFQWGITVPSDPNHVMYVWLDALVNYLTAVEYPNTAVGSRYDKYWPCALHVVGKDITRFHAIYWPAFLMAAGLPVPEKIFSHGWWTMNGEKMSKSVGNVIDPRDLLSQYGTDYVRYFFAAEISFGSDGDFTHERFVHRVNDDLVNGVGNLTQRVLTLVHKHCDGVVPACVAASLTAEDLQLLETAEKNLVQIASQRMDALDLRGYCDGVMDLARLSNKYIDTHTPWHLCKDETTRPRMRVVLHVLAEMIRKIGVMLLPVVPVSGDLMLDQLGTAPEQRTLNSIMERNEAAKHLGPLRPIFPRIITKK